MGSLRFFSRSALPSKSGKNSRERTGDAATSPEAR